MSMRLFALQGIAFGAAFLLFQMELIAAKALLPRFGGSFLVWSMAVVFFQGILILGYLAVHLGIRLLGIRRWFHLYLLLLLLTIPALVTGLPTLLHPVPQLADTPFLPRLLLTLFLSTGPVFWALSTLGVGTQKWLAASGLPEATNPFSLYGISNLGAFAALFSYPLLVEPHLTLVQQITVWQLGYVLLTLVQWAAFPIRFPLPQQEVISAPTGKIFGRERSIWFLLSAAGNALYLATTNLITMDLASVPLLWTLPLGVFLGSFWLTFKARPWYPEWLRTRFYLAVPVGIFLFLLQIKGIDLASVVLSIFLHLLTLFLLCMACLGELHRFRPRDPQQMTGFYLTVAVGGFAGTLLVGWLVPASGIPVLIEYPCAMLLAVLALALDPAARPLHFRDGFWVAAMVLVLLGWPLFSVDGISLQGNLLSMLLAVPTLFIFSALRDKPRPLALTLLAVVLIVPFSDDLAPDRSLTYRHRNHYGIYQIFTKNDRRILKHGSTYHGAQWLDSRRRNIPQLYYHPVTPVGRLLESGAISLHNMAIVGLGTGSLAAYARPGQSMTFFELDPDDGAIARDHFSYLRESRGDIQIRFGDARLSLEEMPNQIYDLLVVDAFNSDSIPIHLLTTEALRAYRRTLRPDGLILFHVSNRFLDLTTALWTNGRFVGAQTLSLANPPPESADAEPSRWVAMSWSSATVEKLVDPLGWSLLNDQDNPPLSRPWTDDYSNLISVLLF
ncbi:MAG: fused MFS/spermidine synthase [Magnetococcales bacterium]|nr:fused MFS/spermidine synthase [Magnetococcales bacterium]MBF0322096.1 fused MFS/spermidine synthase [Magnetococcales bacterium]